MIFALTIRRLRRYLFVYLGQRILLSRFNVFRRALFALGIFPAI